MTAFRFQARFVLFHSRSPATGVLGSHHSVPGKPASLTLSPAWCPTILVSRASLGGFSVSRAADEPPAVPIRPISVSPRRRGLSEIFLDNVLSWFVYWSRPHTRDVSSWRCLASFERRMPRSQGRALGARVHPNLGHVGHTARGNIWLGYGHSVVGIVFSFGVLHLNAEFRRLRQRQAESMDRCDVGTCPMAYPRLSSSYAWIALIHLY